MQDNIRTLSPSTGEVIFERPGATIEEARTMLAQASEAFVSYRKSSLDERKAIVTKALDLLAGMRDQLSQELTTQMGRPIKFSGVEIDTMRKRADYLMGIAPEALADLPGAPESGFKRWVSREPVGPVLIVSAWNVSQEPNPMHLLITEHFVLRQTVLLVSVADYSQHSHPSLAQR